MHIDFQTISDSQLIQKSRDGDDRAYGELVGRYQLLVCSVAYSSCGDLATSEDLAQEAFIRAWQKLDTLNDVSKFKSWVCTIVRNLARRSRENLTRTPTTNAVSFDSVAELRSSAKEPVEKVVSSETEQLVWQALADIPDNYREPMVLFYREEQSVALVAKALDLSQDAVKQRLSRGRKMLQEHLAATVQTVLEDSKPAKAFATAVLVGLSGAKPKAAAAGVVTSAATATGTGMAGTLLVQLAQLPLVAWLFKTALDETRSPQERQLMVRHQVKWMAATAVLAAAMFATVPWIGGIRPPVLRGLVIPGMLVLFYIPMVISHRRLGRRIEQLRNEENTATPLRTMTSNPNGYFVLSGLAVVLWPSIMPLLSHDWRSAIVLPLAACLINLCGAQFSRKRPARLFLAYASSLGVTALVGVCVMVVRRDVWAPAFSNHLLWFMGTMQAMAMTYVILSVVSWRRVYGKRKD
jgi:RNA polymerase sigma factor (sigma-70 family)